MQPGTQTTMSFLFFVGTVIVSLVTVQGNFPRGVTKFIDKRVVQNFVHDNNKIINKDIIPQHLSASYTYLALAFCFDRADVALPGFSKFFRKASDRELTNANKMIEYINKRGGMQRFRDINVDVNATMCTSGEAGIIVLKHALNMERDMNARLLNLHAAATRTRDVHLKHSLEDEFMDQKVELIKEYADHIAVLEAMRGEDYGLGEYTFDKDL